MRNAGLILGVVVAAAALAGCGSGSDSAARVAPQPALPSALAHDLAARSDAIAASLAGGANCRAKRQAAALQDATVDAVNAGQVPPALQEELTSSVTDLASRIECTPAPVRASVKTTAEQTTSGAPPQAQPTPAQVASPVRPAARSKPAASKPAKPKPAEKPRKPKKTKKPKRAVVVQQPPPPPPTTTVDDTPPMPIDPGPKGKGKKKDPPPPKTDQGNGKKGGG